MSLRKPYSESPTGPLVSPWLLFGRDARIITLFGLIHSSTSVPVITSDSMPFLAEEFFADLMFLGQSSREPIRIIINNSGGSVPAGLTIINGIEHLQHNGIDVEVLVLGASMSMASIVLASGTEGKRYALSRSIIHFHNGYQRSEGSPEDKKRIDEFQERLTLQMYAILADRTKIPEYYVAKEIPEVSISRLGEKEIRMKYIRRFLDGETFLSAEQALEAGVIDKVIAPGDQLLDTIFSLKETEAKEVAI